MATNDGGPAFPTVDANYREGDYGTMGMSLRDYFAAAALQGIIAAYPQANVPDAAATAFQYADALLAAREKKQ